MPVGNKERHRTERIGWLRAAVTQSSSAAISAFLDGKPTI
jgi:hypothetical protein